jgi:hypothetical protein
MNSRQCIWVLVVVLGIATSGGTVRAAASPAPQDQTHDQAHDQDYSKNKNYQLGMNDGKDDKAHKKDHSRNRKFKKDDDQKAYEAGYQLSHQGDQPDHR